MFVNTWLSDSFRFMLECMMTLSELRSMSLASLEDLFIPTLRPDRNYKGFVFKLAGNNHWLRDSQWNSCVLINVPHNEIMTERIYWCDIHCSSVIKQLNTVLLHVYLRVNSLMSVCFKQLFQFGDLITLSVQHERLLLFWKGDIL